MDTSDKENSNGNRMIELAGGYFFMGSDQHYPEERPRRKETVGEFAMDIYAVSNREFAVFVNDTGYITSAEKPLDPAQSSSNNAEELVPGSLVFHKTEGPVNLSDFRNWWRFIPGACWHAPEGPDSPITDRMDHPVVHVSYFDAIAYAEWAGKALPTEKEWEFAAQAGAETEFPWGDELSPDGKAKANTWFGSFPYDNKRIPDGPPFTAPVGSFQPNEFGLFDMIGNVWEWTATRFSGHSTQNCCTPAKEVRAGELIVVKGGSHLCAPSYCRRYRSAARSPQESLSSSSHIGFRCIARRY